MEVGSVLASAAPRTFSLTCAHFKGWKRQLSLAYMCLTCLHCPRSQHRLLSLGGPTRQKDPGLTEPGARGCILPDLALFLPAGTWLPACVRAGGVPKRKRPAPLHGTGTRAHRGGCSSFCLARVSHLNAPLCQRRQIPSVAQKEPTTTRFYPALRPVEVSHRVPPTAPRRCWLQPGGGRSSLVSQGKKRLQQRWNKQNFFLHLEGEAQS